MPSPIQVQQHNLSSMLVAPLFVLLILASMASAKKECLDIIRELAVYDRQLGSTPTSLRSYST